MSVHYTRRQSYVPPINRPHAVDRWHERTPAKVSVRDAWKAAFPVDAPQCDAEAVRLYAPYEMLLVVRAGLLRTELHSDYRTDTSGLFPCPNCADLVDPSRSTTCPWCGATLDELTAGRITITREEPR